MAGQACRRRSGQRAVASHVATDASSIKWFEKVRSARILRRLRRLRGHRYGRWSSDKWMAALWAARRRFATLVLALRTVDDECAHGQPPFMPHNTMQVCARPCNPPRRDTRDRELRHPHPPKDHGCNDQQHQHHRGHAPRRHGRHRCGVGEDRQRPHDAVRVGVESVPRGTSGLNLQPNVDGPAACMGLP